MESICCNWDNQSKVEITPLLHSRCKVGSIVFIAKISICTTYCMLLWLLDGRWVCVCVCPHSRRECPAFVLSQHLTLIAWLCRMCRMCIGYILQSYRSLSSGGRVDLAAALSMNSTNHPWHDSNITFVWTYAVSQSFSWVTWISCKMQSVCGARGKNSRATHIFVVCTLNVLWPGRLVGPHEADFLAEGGGIPPCKT